MEERYHGTTQNRFYPDMYNINKNITVEAKLISPLTYIYFLQSQANVTPNKHLDFIRNIFSWISKHYIVNTVF